MPLPTFPAPELVTERWFNTDRDVTLEGLEGSVVVVYAFQMLCLGCVEVSLPQAREVHATYAPEHVSVIGLHTVFEQHAAMAPAALEVFLREHEITFPVGVDLPGAGSLPTTMRAYDMQGTPTIILFDHRRKRRLQHFGHVSDLALGAAISSLLIEAEQEGHRYPR